MDSKRRMVEIHIWDQPFFSELSQTEKLFYWLVICKCDNVGVYQHNPKLAAFHCEGEIELKTFIDKVNFDRERFTILNDGSVWIKDFVRDTWGTIAAGNNLGVSCYKLLAKHGLLERFISEYPNCVNIKSFRDAITEGELNLPLPQGSPKPAPENGECEEYEGQGSPRAGTINKGINKDISVSIDNAQFLLEAYPRKHKDGSDISVLATIEDVLEDLKLDGVKDPAEYLMNEIDKLDKKTAPEPNIFFESIKERSELPF
ncbi:MAG: hypothetical protein U5K69_30045 [Balneolaceae bacterium]|nr:hypothetical protein [Balneolaceae bacterium]